MSTRIAQAGIETGDLSELTWNVAGQVPTASTGRYYGGGYALRSSQNDIPVGFTLPANVAELRFGYWISSIGLYTGVANTKASLVTFYLADGKYTELVWNSTTGLLSLIVDTAFGTSSPTPVATTPATSAPGLTQRLLWNHLGFLLRCHSAGGLFQFYCNGQLVLAYSGDLTEQTVQAVGGTGLPRAWAVNYAWDSYCYHDDYYVDDITGDPDGCPPPLVFHPLRPNANGASSQWLGSDGNQVDNYALVDEAPPSASDYVYSTNAGDIDSYGLSDPILRPGSTVNAVIAMAVARRGGAAAPPLQMGTRLNGTNLLSANKSLAVNWALLQERQTTKPGGGAWSASDVNAAELVLAVGS